MTPAATTFSPAEAHDGPWYRKAFEAGYLELYAHRDEADAARAVEFVASQAALGRDARLLDLCCGPGRHLGLLAPRVARACGLDLSQVLLQRADEFCRGKLRDAGIKARGRLALVRGDMRSLPFADETFSVVVNLFTSMGYFEDERDNARVLREVARALEPGGVLVIDHINRDHLEETLQPVSERQLRTGARVTERRSFEPGASRVLKHVQWSQEGRTTEWIESVRVYDFGEFKALLRGSGFAVEKAFGDFDGSDFTRDSPRMIVLASRKKS